MKNGPAAGYIRVYDVRYKKFVHDSFTTSSGWLNCIQCNL